MHTSVVLVKLQAYAAQVSRTEYLEHITTTSTFYDYIVEIFCTSILYYFIVQIFSKISRATIVY